MQVHAPFPYFGSKERAAPVINERLGEDLHTYIEPFAGSAAILLSRPPAKLELLNDKDALITNFWRAAKADPEAWIYSAARPTSQHELAAAGAYLYKIKDDLYQRIREDLDYYDPKAAGVWCWVQSAGIGGAKVERHHPYSGIPQWRPNGVQLHRAIFDYNAADPGAHLRDWAYALRDRLACVVLHARDWRKFNSDTLIGEDGFTGILLDPPYLTDRRIESRLYDHDSGQVAHEVAEWAIKTERRHGGKVRIVLCGYAGDYDMPPDWRCEVWGKGGGRTYDKRQQDAIWTSPGCIQGKQLALIQ